MKIEIKLWVKAKDVVTWFTWIVTAKYTFLTWCDRYQITPEYKDWKVEESMAFDENQIKYVWQWVVKHFEEDKPTNGKEDLPKKWWPMIYKCRNM